MEFKKLKKGILKKGIKAALFTLALGTMIFGMMQFKDDEVQAWSGWASSGDELYPPNGNTYDRTLATPISRYGLDAYVLSSLDYYEFIVWLSGKLESGTTHSQLNEFIKSINPSTSFIGDDAPLIYYIDADFSDTADLSYMFSGVSRLKEVVFDDSVDTSSITNMSYMFHNCENLESIYLGTNFNTSNVTDMSLMFYGPVSNMSKLKKITYSNNFVTTKVQNFNSMFGGCNAITELDLSKFTFDKDNNNLAPSLLNNNGSRPLMDLETITIPDKKIVLQHEWDSITLPSGKNWYLYDKNWNKVVDNSFTSLVSKEDYPTAKYLSSVIYIDEYGNKYFPNDIYVHNDSSCKWNISESGEDDLWAYALKKKNKNGNYISNEKFLLITGSDPNIKEYSSSNKTEWCDIENIKSAIVNKGCNPNSIAYLFHNMWYLEKVDFLVEGTEKKTPSNFDYAFSGNLIKELDLSNFDSHVTSMINAFSCQDELTNIIGLENLDVSGCTNFCSAFNCSPKLTSIDLSSWNVSSSAISFKWMFMSSSKLKEIDISNFNIGDGADTEDMFDGCSALVKIKVPASTKAGITLPNGTWSLLNSNNEKIDTLKTELVSKESDGDYLALDALYIDELGNEYYVNDIVKTSGSLDKWDLSESGQGQLMAYVFEKKDEDGNPVADDLMLVITGPDENIKVLNPTPWLTRGLSTSIKSAVIAKGCNPKSYYQLFLSLTNLESITFEVDESINEKKWVTNLDAAFCSCIKLKRLDFSNFDKDKCQITNMVSTFANCSELVEIKGLENFDVSGVTDFTSTFSGCSSLKTFDVSSWDMSNAKILQTTFSGLDSLSEIDFSCFEFNSIDSDGFGFVSGRNLNKIILPITTNNKKLKMALVSQDDWYLYSNGIKGEKITDNSIPARIKVGDYIQRDPIVCIDGVNYYYSDAIWYDEDHNMSSKEKRAAWNISDTGTDNLWAGVFNKKTGNSPEDFLDDEYVLLFWGDYDKAIEFEKSYQYYYGGEYYFFDSDSMGTGFSSLDWSSWRTNQFTPWTLIGEDEVPKIKSAVMTKDCYFDNHAFLFADLYGLEEVTFEKDGENLRTPTSIEGMFAECSNLEKVNGFESLKIENITNFKTVFYCCTKLKDLDFKNWNFYMGQYFKYFLHGCRGLSDIDIGAWNIDHPLSMKCMLSCTNFKELDLSAWSVNSCSDFSQMFAGNPELEKLNISTWNMQDSANVTSMFWDYDNSWETPNLGYIDLPNSCKACDYVYLNDEEFYIYNKVGKIYERRSYGDTKTSSYYIPYPASSASYADAKGTTSSLYANVMVTPAWLNSQVLFADGDINYTYGDLVTYDDGHDASTYAMWNISKTDGDLYACVFKQKDSTGSYIDAENNYLLVFIGEATDIVEFKYAFDYHTQYGDYDCFTPYPTPYDDTSWHSWLKEDWKTNGVTPWSYLIPKFKIKSAVIAEGCNPESYSVMFAGLNGMKNIRIEEKAGVKKTPNSMYAMFYFDSALESFVVPECLDTSNVTSLYCAFGACTNLATLDLTNLDTSNCVDMFNMFSSCSNLTSITGIEDLNTSKVKDFSQMFISDTNLTGTLDLSKWDVSSGEDFHSMFSDTWGSLNIILKGWDAQKGKTFKGMFQSCKATSIDVSGWKLRDAENFESMFQSLWFVTKLDLSSWDVSNATNFKSMFNNSSKLERLDLSNWTTTNASDMSSMLNGCSGLEELDISNFEISDAATTSSMLSGCSNLKTIYIPKKVEVTDDITLPDSFEYFNIDKKTLTQLKAWGNTSGNVLLGSDSEVKLADGSQTDLKFNLMKLSGYSLDLGPLMLDDGITLDEKKYNTGDTIQIKIKFDENVSKKDGLLNPELNFTISGEKGTITGPASFKEISGDTVIFTYTLKNSDIICGELTLNVSGITNSHLLVDDNNHPIFALTGQKDLTGFEVAKKPSDGGGGGSGGGAAPAAPILPEPLEPKIISYLKAYMNGYEDGTFKPSNFITREEVAVISARLTEGFDENENYSDSNTFIDTSLRWSENYLGFCKKNGIIKGYEDNSYKPTSNMTRGELASLVLNFINKNIGMDKYQKLSNVTLSDLDGKWYENEVKTLVELGILNGYEDGTFKGDNFVSRIEVAIVMNKVTDRTIKEPIDDEYIKKVTSSFTDVDEDRWFFKDALKAVIDLPVYDSEQIETNK